ncbi:MAG TPA: DUF4118 domain-containing protein, partial [Ferruginibacter sp.]|nr:DUF4118 domain-containing protein [Ferruginibacter sp.]
MPSVASRNKFTRQVTTVWNSPRVTELRATVAKWQKLHYSGTVILVIGTVLATLLIMALNRTSLLLPNPGLVYLPLVAFLAYYWNWRYAVIATLLQLFCVYFFFIPPI